MLTPFAAAALAGFGLCLSLIIAPGAQNVFLLRMGVHRQHVVALAITCLASDAILIALGVAGVGAAVTKVPWLFEVVRWGGVLFLTWYGLAAAWRAIRPKAESLALDAPPRTRVERDALGDPPPAPAGTSGTMTLTRARTARRTGTLLPAVLSCLAITWLNPHGYLDTVFLLGSVSAGYGDARWAFGAGAVLGSATWFTFLALASRFAARWLASPRAWRLLDALIAVAMLALAAGLALA
ncbi:LysE/ArgO family amino acid transporter [Microbacterium album]|uniref:Lysine exporter protein n=1 Tax=Microbacterium album TaxID=2053191 RepID=A0A917IDI5_9MICO|nr:LysE family transporter [Microbacterium album]GGH36630.1 lysine exporter protein [Microbacterium album]